MSKRILITGSTDGIGLETARSLIDDGHDVILHGRNPEKLASQVDALGGNLPAYVADLSDLKAVQSFAHAVIGDDQSLDILINNAGVLKMPDPIGPDGLDRRFVVNTIAPYLLMMTLRPVMNKGARIINLSSAAQAPVDMDVFLGEKHPASDMEAYAQSKLAITMWSAYLAENIPELAIIAVNPGSLLASKMVKEGFGIAGNDVTIGVDILKRAALSDAFADKSGAYFDNDQGQFSAPHPAGQDMRLAEELVHAMDRITKDALAV